MILKENSFFKKKSMLGTWLEEGAQSTLQLPNINVK